MSHALRVAAVQAAPVYMNLARTMENTLALIRDAASLGARVVAFPETWLPGYPAWLDCCRDAALWDHAPTKEVFAQLVANSVAIPGPETRSLSAIAKDLSIILNIGAHEKLPGGPGHGTLYNSMLTFGPDGSLLNLHRKIMPTFTERLIWGQGDGSGLKAVNTPAGRIGGLICWEHWMPLARQVLHISREEIHIAAWPWVKEMNLIASRHYAFEARSFVIACGALMSARDLPASLEPIAALKRRPDTLILRGGSAVIAPNGDLLAGPVLDKEIILIADLDLSTITKETLALDVTGHYSRPDLFNLALKTV